MLRPPLLIRQIPPPALNAKSRVHEALRRRVSEIQPDAHGSCPIEKLFGRDQLHTHAPAATAVVDTVIVKLLHDGLKQRAGALAIANLQINH